MADIYGSQSAAQWGSTKRPASPDAKPSFRCTINGVTLMKHRALMLGEDKPVPIVWRGPDAHGRRAGNRLLGGRWEWGELDVLLVDLPPGTGAMCKLDAVPEIRQVTGADRVFSTAAGRRTSGCTQGAEHVRIYHSRRPLLGLD